MAHFLKCSLSVASADINARLQKIMLFLSPTNDIIQGRNQFFVMSQFHPVYQVYLEIISFLFYNTLQYTAVSKKIYTPKHMSIMGLRSFQKDTVGPCWS